MQLAQKEVLSLFRAPIGCCRLANRHKHTPKNNKKQNKTKQNKTKRTNKNKQTKANKRQNTHTHTHKYIHIYISECNNLTYSVANRRLDSELCRDVCSTCRERPTLVATLAARWRTFSLESRRRTNKCPFLSLHARRKHRDHCKAPIARDKESRSRERQRAVRKTSSD